MLEAARAQATTQNLDIRIGANDCARLRRTVSASSTSASVEVDGTVRLAIEILTTTASGSYDVDGDGVADHSFATSADDAGLPKRVDIELAEDGVTPTTRMTVYEKSGEPWVDFEAPDDTTGQLSLVASLAADFHAAPANCTGPTGPFTPCSPDQTAKAEAALKHAMNVGELCLNTYGASKQTVDNMYNYTFRPIRFECGPLRPCSAAQLDRDSWKHPNRDIVIRLQTSPGHTADGSKQYPNGFFSMDATEQASTLWHEMQHASRGPHKSWAPGGANTDSYPDFDPVTACENLCFGSATVNKCTCATCLQTSTCDPRCRLLPDCNENALYQCPCKVGPNAGRVFQTCRECLTTCPSMGLGCVGFSRCRPLTDISCPGSAPKCPP